MNLFDFENHFDKVILERGFDYFDHGHIETIDEIKQNQYLVQVVGTSNYNVEVSIDGDNEIVGSFCDCPYDWGDYCKHQAAAFYALRQKLHFTSEKPKNKKSDIRKTLADLSYDELQEMIIKLSEENYDIKKNILFQYGAKEDEIQSSKKLIKEYINKAKSRGFIEWNRVSDALRGAEMSLEKADKKMEVGETESAVFLSITVLSPVVDMLQYCDDSNGFVGSVIEESFDIIDQALTSNIHQLKDSQKKGIFKKLMKEALHKRYDGWDDLRIRLLEMCIYFCSISDLRSKLEKQIHNMLENLSGESWFSEYKKEQLLLLKLQLIERFDEEEKGLKFIFEHLDLNPFREKAITHLIEKGEFSQALSLCEEGEEIDKEFPGLVDRWKKYQLLVYEKLGDVTMQKKLLQDFVYENEYTYYSRLKTLYKPEEWNNVLQEMIETFEKQSYPPSTYVEILKTEKMSDKLLRYCQNHKPEIEYLHPYLIKDYFEEVIKLFAEWIEIEAHESSNRKQYKKVCKKIKTFKKVCGDIHAHLLIENLQQTYKRRPAFIDELEKI
ncbi:SWIM zinc finger family protein [Bacillus gobiensis]|uniref:SWIM zinc finger family protein n=1 Tax=Bacillus gobiensis TaxID=1441095 RepID=UPI003D1EF489